MLLKHTGSSYGGAWDVYGGLPPDYMILETFIADPIFQQLQDIWNENKGDRRFRRPINLAD